jgi:hypothetical protein
MEYENMLNKFSVLELKGIIKTYMKEIKITSSKKKKSELIEHILKHTELKDGKIVLKSKSLELPEPKKQDKKETKKETKKEAVKLEAVKAEKVEVKKPKEMTATEIKEVLKLEPVKVEKVKMEPKKAIQRVDMAKLQEERVINSIIKRLLVDLEVYNRDKSNKTNRKKLATKWDNVSMKVKQALKREHKVEFDDLQNILKMVKDDLSRKNI